MEELGEGYGHAPEGPTIIYCPLHAAAGDLLAALEASWPGMVGDDDAYDRPIREVHEQVRAAIAKAKGEA